MNQYESDWVFNIGLKVAVIICLATLAVGLTIGLSPVTAVFRSGSAFAVFATISWAAALMWEPALPQEATEDASDADEAEAQDEKKETSPPEQQDEIEAPQAEQQVV